MKDFDLEEELAAAMLDRSRQVPPHSYDVDGLIGSVRRRRRRLWTGAAAAVAITALGVGFVAEDTHDRGSVPVPVATAPRTDMPPAPTVPPSAPASTAKPSADPARTTHTLFLSALRYQSPNTRSQVDPAEVAALFANEPTYRRIWGTDSLGVTCGSTVDGVLVPGVALLYQGSNRLDQTVSLTFDGATGKVTDLTCKPIDENGKGVDDPTVSNIYGGMVSGAKSGSTTALGEQFLTDPLRGAQGTTAGICFSTTARFWLADNPSSATLTHGWTVNLGGEVTFPIEINENGKIVSSCGG